MIDSIHSFLQKIKEHKHVLQLIKETDPIMICFISSQENVSLVLKNGEVSMLHDTEEVFNKYQIYGELAAIEQLLTGKERLRVLIQKGRLKFSAPFRLVLMLESLFYLTKVDEKRIKII